MAPRDTGDRDRGHTWVDLTQPFGEGIPHSPSQPPPSVETLASIEEDGVGVQQYCATTHVGTHVDAPRHLLADGATIDEFPPERFVGPGVVLGLSRETPAEIPVDAVETAAADAGFRAGDIVLCYTGWGDDYPDSSYERYSWLADEVGPWLLDREVPLLGVDTPSPDRPRAFRPDDWSAYPIHYALLEREVLVAENLSLGAVVGERVEVFGFPTKVADGDGAPARFVARV